MSGTYQLVASGSGAGEFVQNVLHFHLNESGAGTAFEYARELGTAFLPTLDAWRDCISALFEFSSIRMKKVSGAGGPTSIITFAPGDKIGTIGDPIYETGMAALLEFPVALNGKNVTGKMFMSGIASTSVENNRPTTALETLLGTFLTALLGTLTLSGALGTAQFCIYNRATQVDQIVTASYVSPLIGTQRRRLHPI